MHISARITKREAASGIEDMLKEAQDKKSAEDQFVKKITKKKKIGTK
jgi:hypothetical protein